MSGTKDVPMDVEFDLDDTIEEPELKAPKADLPDSKDFDDQEALFVEESVAARSNNAIQGKSVLDDDGEPDEEEAIAQRLTEAEQRSRETEAAAAISIARSEAMMVQSQHDSARVALDTLNARIAETKRAHAEARRAGDVDSELQLESVLNDMTTLRQQIEQARSQLPDPKDIIAYGETKARQALAQPRSKVVGAGLGATHPLAERWAASNSWLMSDRKASSAVIEISQKLVDKGFDPNRSGFYQQLTIEMSRRFPNAKVATIGSGKRFGPSRPQAKSPVAPTRSVSAGGAQRPAMAGNRYTLTSEDVLAMKRMNLDPTNVAHRKSFAKARLESARRSAS